MKTKKCFKCGVEKSFSQFYKHPKMADGIVGKCKECNKKDVQANRSDRIEYYREYDRKRADIPYRVKQRKQLIKRFKTDPKLKKIKRESTRAWRQRNKIKYEAHIIVGYAIKEGRIKSKPCEVCKDKNTHAHHDDYTKPLSVRWLCPKHHMQHHKEERECLRKLKRLKETP